VPETSLSHVQIRALIFQFIYFIDDLFGIFCGKEDIDQAFVAGDLTGSGQ
jgi:hypothetical protein